MVDTFAFKKAILSCTMNFTKKNQVNHRLLNSILIKLSVFIFLVFFLLTNPVKAHASDLFSDGFESGDLSAWDSSHTSSGDVSVTEGAKLHGTYGMNILLDDSNNKDVVDNTPDAETRYRARFYMDTNSIAMAENDRFYILNTFNTDWTETYRIELKYISGEYTLIIIERADDAYATTSRYTISDAPHYIEVDWQASSAPGANDGSFSLWIDGELKEAVESVDNDTEEISNILLGAIGVDAGTTGTLYLDDFASNDDGTEIGVYKTPPSAPSSLAQYKADGTTVIDSADWTNESTVTLKFSMSSDNNPDSLTPQVEIRETGTDFSNAVTNSGDAVVSSTDPVTGTVTVTGLTSHKTYHWQARVSNAGGQSSWVAMGGSPDFGSDTSAPTEGSIIYTGGEYSVASVALTVNDGADIGSGVNTSTRIIQRRSATLADGSCGTYGSFATITPTGAYPDFTDTTVVSGKCYQYQYLVSDNFAHQATYSALDLGSGVYSTEDTSVFDGYVDTLLANGFTQIRVDIPDYQDATLLARSKAAVIRAVAKGANVVWGVSSNNGNDVDYTITTENWPDFRLAILDAAQWAQDNGVYEFQLGNEEEDSLWRHPVSITRTSNVATATFAEDHGFTDANPVIIWGATPEDFNAYTATPTDITVTGPKTFTYDSVGDDGSVSNPGSTSVGNMPEDTIQANIKALATDVKAIFTRGNVSYTTSSSYFMDKWHTLGRGDIDILAWNVYANTEDWQDDVTNMIDWWGVEHSYITEFSVSYVSLDSYSTDEAVQAAGIESMLDYLKASGIQRALFYVYKAEGFGALKGDGTYRQLWENLKAHVNTVEVNIAVPSSPSSLAQYRSDGSTVIPSGGVLSNGSDVVLKFNMSSSNSADTLTPQVEIQLKDNPFTNTPTHTGTAVAYSGTAVTGTVTIPDLSGGHYHWQARVSNSIGQSSWVSMGGSPDFSVEFPPASDNSTPSSCGDQKPGAKAPWLYGAIARDNSSILLYFTPNDSPVDKYVLEYGTKSGDYQYGVQNMGLNSRGQMVFLVSSLSHNTTYYFRVRAGNGCAVGSWSNEISAKTKGLASTDQLEITSSELIPQTTITEPSPAGASGSKQETPKTTEDGEPQVQTQVYDVRVKVTDTDKQPVLGATVTLHSNPQTAKTDKEGIVLFHNVEQGDHKVLIAYGNFQGEESIYLTGDVKQFDLNVTIKPQNILLSPIVIGIVSVSAVIILVLGFLLMRVKIQLRATDESGE